RLPFDYGPTHGNCDAGVRPPSVSDWVARGSRMNTLCSTEHLVPCIVAAVVAVPNTQSMSALRSAEALHPAALLAKPSPPTNGFRSPNVTRPHFVGMPPAFLGSLNAASLASIAAGIFPQAVVAAARQLAGGTVSISLASSQRTTFSVQLCILLAVMRAMERTLLWKRVSHASSEALEEAGGATPPGL